MSYRLSRAQRALQEPGNCTTCGNFDKYRNSAGQCMPCHNRQYIESRERHKAYLDAMPRCEFCNRRAQATVASGEVRVCGAHLNKCKAQYDAEVLRTTGGIMFIGGGFRPTAEEVRKWAVA